MSVLKVGANSVPPTSADTTAPSTTEKRTTRIANGILRFFKATESGPIRQSVTVGFGVGVFFLGIGGVFGALVGFIHGIFASLKLHNLRVKEKKEYFQQLKADVEAATKDENVTLAPQMASKMLMELKQFKAAYNELCIFDDDETDEQLIVLQGLIVPFMQKEAITELNILKDKINTLTEAYTQGSTPELLAQALELKKSIKAINNKYEAFRTNEFKRDVSQLAKDLKPIIEHGNAELIRLEKEVELYIKSYKTNDVLQGGPELLIEKIKTFTCVYGEEKVGKLIERLFPFTAAGQHMITDLSKELSTATMDSEATVTALKGL